MSYRDEVLADSPTVYLRLGEASGSGTVVDETGNGHNGTVVGATLGEPGIIGGGDTAARFDGVDDRIVVPNHVNLDTSNYTYEFWFYDTGNSSAGTQQRLVEYDLFYIYFDEGGVGETSLTDETLLVHNATFQPRALNVNMTLGHHVVATCEGLNSEIWVDGVLKGTRADGPATTNGDLWLSGNNDKKYMGVLDEFARYNYALSAARIQAHYAAGAPATEVQAFAPDAILAMSGLTGAVAAIQDDPDSPDGSWLVFG